MVETFKDLNLQTANLEELYNNPTKATQTNIQQMAYEMLEILISTDSNEIITKHVLWLIIKKQ